jgi:hypothetical protein
MDIEAGRNMERNASKMQTFAGKEIDIIHSSTQTLATF